MEDTKPSEMLNNQILGWDGDIAEEIYFWVGFHLAHKAKPHIIRKVLQKRFKFIITGPNPEYFWLPLAYAEWVYDILEPQIHRKVEMLANFELNSDTSSMTAEQQIERQQKQILMQNLLALFAQKCPDTPVLLKPEIIKPLFKKGDCVAFNLSNGLWSGFYITGAANVPRYKDLGHNTFIQTDILKPNRPTIRDFKSSRIIPVHSFYRLAEKNETKHFLAHDLLRERPNQKLEVVGNIPCFIQVSRRHAAFWDGYLASLEEYFQNPLYENAKLKTFKRFSSPFFNAASPLAVAMFLIIFFIFAELLLALTEHFSK